jgi:hypothetical protein
MRERATSPKSSETDPPAANQPLNHDRKRAGKARVLRRVIRLDPNPATPPGKPDGEVDTRS